MLVKRVGMKRLVTTLALALTSFNSGIAQTQAGSTSVPFQNVLVGDPAATQPVKFIIDTSTVGNYETIFVAGETVHIDGATEGTIDVPSPTEDEPIVYVRLQNADVSKAGGGEDVLVLGKKDTLEFSAENTARARLTGLLPFFMVTLEETLQAYDSFPEHPEFAELVELYDQQKGLPADETAIEEIGTLSGEIVLDVMNELRQGSGLE